jgi:flagellar basal-body rod protein FlgG
MAINGNGFFQVELPDGAIGYTRDGSFQLDADGTLVTSNGYQVLGPITVPDNVQSINVGADGVVSVNVAGQAQPQQIGQIQLATFINSSGLAPQGQNYFTETAASGAPNTTVPGQLQT